MRKAIQWILAAAAIIASAGPAWAADEPSAGTPPMHHGASAKGANPTDDELIASAMKAAPKNVAENATIVTPEPKGGMRTHCERGLMASRVCLTILKRQDLTLCAGTRMLERGLTRT